MHVLHYNNVKFDFKWNLVYLRVGWILMLLVSFVFWGKGGNQESTLKHIFDL